MVSNNLRTQLLEVADRLDHLRDIQAILEIIDDVSEDSRIDQEEKLKRILMLLDYYRNETNPQLEAMNEAVIQARKGAR